MVSEQDYTQEVPAEQRVGSEHEYTREVPAADRDQRVGTEQGYSKEEPADAAGTRKPSMMEQVKEKVADVKDKLTGHSHHASPTTKHAESETHAAAKPQSPKGEGFLQKIKEKLPGTHGHEHKTAHATTTPGHMATETTEPAVSGQTGEPVHGEGIVEKVRHMFKGGRSDAKTGEHTREEPLSRKVEAVPDPEALKG